MLCLSFCANGQNTHPIFPELYDQQLLDSLTSQYKPEVVLNYGNARDYLYGKVYNENDTVECVYSGHKLHLPQGVDPSTFLFQNGSNDGINCEHTYPRSKGADEDNGNAYSDMHHLFPTRSQVNSGRENFPYAEIPDEESTHWYFQNEVKNNIPFQYINSYSERVNGRFEPREAHKGNVARAIFYFYTMYKEEADEADAYFFDIQKETLCKWNLSDPVDENEIMRTFLIAEKQDDLGNPFIIDNSLVDRCYCSEFTTATTSPSSIDRRMVNIYPNPVQTNSTLLIESSFGELLNIQFYNNLGSKIASQTLNIQKGINHFPTQNLTMGCYYYNVIDPSSGKIVSNGKFQVL